MSYPSCYSHWIECEVANSVWETQLPTLAGCRTIAEARERIQEIRQLGAPWAARPFRVVDRFGAVLPLADLPLHGSAVVATPILPSRGRRPVAQTAPAAFMRRRGS